MGPCMLDKLEPSKVVSLSKLSLVALAGVGVLFGLFAFVSGFSAFGISFFAGVNALLTGLFIIAASLVGLAIGFCLLSFVFSHIDSKNLLLELVKQQGKQQSQIMSALNQALNLLNKGSATEQDINELLSLETQTDYSIVDKAKVAVSANRKSPVETKVEVEAKLEAVKTNNLDLSKTGAEIVDDESPILADATINEKEAAQTKIANTLEQTVAKDSVEEHKTSEIAVEAQKSTQDTIEPVVQAPAYFETSPVQKLKNNTKTTLVTNTVKKDFVDAKVKSNGNISENLDLETAAAAPKVQEKPKFESAAQRKRALREGNKADVIEKVTLTTEPPVLKEPDVKTVAPTLKALEKEIKTNIDAKAVELEAKSLDKANTELKNEITKAVKPEAEKSEEQADKPVKTVKLGTVARGEKMAFKQDTNNSILADMAKNKTTAEDTKSATESLSQGGMSFTFADELNAPDSIQMNDSKSKPFESAAQRKRARRGKSLSQRIDEKIASNAEPTINLDTSKPKPSSTVASVAPAKREETKQAPLNPERKALKAEKKNKINKETPKQPVMQESNSLASKTKDEPVKLSPTLEESVFRKKKHINTAADESAVANPVVELDVNEGEDKKEKSAKLNQLFSKLKAKITNKIPSPRQSEKVEPEMDLNIDTEQSVDSELKVNPELVANQKKAKSEAEQPSSVKDSVDTAPVNKPKVTSDADNKARSMRRRRRRSR